MSSSYTPILVGVVSPVSEILLPSKTAKFPFRPMDYIGSKNSMVIKKFGDKILLIGINESAQKIYASRD